MMYGAWVGCVSARMKMGLLLSRFYTARDVSFGNGSGPSQLAVRLVPSSYLVDLPCLVCDHLVLEAGHDAVGMPDGQVGDLLMAGRRRNAVRDDVARNGGRLARERCRAVGKEHVVVDGP